MKRTKVLSAAAVMLGLGIDFHASAQVHVLTYHNNNRRTGENLEEIILTPSNVNSKTFGKLFTYSVDGYVYAQPLYVSGLNIPNEGTHNVVFVATQHNSVYAFDADTNAGRSAGPLWQVNLGPSAATPTTDFGDRFGGFDYIVPEVGITGTPVIDLASGTLYVDAFTHEGSNYYHRIHALDITTGMERSFSPMLVSASVPGVGVGSSGGVVHFDPKQQLQRSALTLSGGVLYVNYTSYAITDPYHGWIMGYDAATLQPLPGHVFNSSPNGTVAQFGAHAGEAGIWMAGGGIAVDGNGDLYFTTGNGYFNAFNGSAGTEYGDTLLRLTGSLSIADYFTPYNHQFLADNDLDLGSGGVLLLPDQSGPYPHLLLCGGKEGEIYVVNRDQMTSDNQHCNTTNSSDLVVQTFSIVGGSFGTPAWYNGRIYYAANGQPLVSFPIANGTVDIASTSHGPRKFGFPGATPSVSANGDREGIVWALQRATPGVLAAYNATDLTKEIYNSSQAGTRDRLTAGIKFTVPTIANGKVYVGGQYAVSVFGSLGPATNYPSPAATYSGLFSESGGVQFLASGSFTAVTTTRGSFTGKLQIGARRYPFSGRFDSLGSATKTILRPGDTTLTLALQIDVRDNNQITGTVSDGTWETDLIAYRALFNARTSPAPFAGRYTLILPGPADGNSQIPQGDGYGTVLVSSSGKAKIAGALADGTKFTQTAALSKDGQWPVYASLYGGRGQLLGWLNFTVEPDDLAGELSWIKLQNSRNIYYPEGFDLSLEANGSAYQPPPRNMQVLNFTDGVVTLTGDSLTEDIVNDVTVSSNDKVTNLGSNKLTLTLAPASGLFRGTVVNPADGKPIPFFGAVLQDQNAGSGYFLRQSQSGRVVFGPRCEPGQGRVPTPPRAACAVGSGGQGRER